MLLPFLVSILLGTSVNHVDCRVSFVDLSYWMDNATPIWPEHKTLNMTKLEIRGVGSAVGQSEILEMATHFGTHVDAPIHMLMNRWTLDEIPMEHWNGPGVMIDLEGRVGNNQDYEITKQDILDFERKHGRIPRKGIVLFKTGWGKRWNSVKDYLGTDTKDVNLLAFPGLSGEAARFLVSERDIVGVGLDTCSLDPGRTRSFEAHMTLCEANKWGIENVANLERLPPKGFLIHVFPMKLMGASGAPARVVANIGARM